MMGAQLSAPRVLVLPDGSADGRHHALLFIV